MTQPIWQGWMKAVHKDLQPVEWQKPSGVQTLPAFVVRSKVGLGSVEPSPANDLYPSWYKQPAQRSGGNQTIDKVSNKLATSCTPERAKQTANNASANMFSVDSLAPGGTANANTSEQDDVHKCNDAKPSVTVTASGCSVVATVTQGTHAINSGQFPGTVNFVINGQTVNSQQVGNSPASVSFTVPGGTTSVTAQVIDSVLYDASATTNVNCGGSAALSVQTAKASGGNTSFAWSGGQATVYRQDNNNTLCNGNGSCSVSSGSAPPGTGIYVKNGSGDIATATVTN
jgi:hypothetical protein